MGQAAIYFCSVALIYGRIRKPNILCEEIYGGDWRSGAGRRRGGGGGSWCGICTSVCVFVYLIMLHIYLNSVCWLGPLCYLKPLVKNVNTVSPLFPIPAVLNAHRIQLQKML